MAVAERSLVFEGRGSSLAAKLATVMTEVQYIQKRGRNTHFGYTYATEADVADRVREALARERVAFLPRVLPETIQILPIETRNGKQLLFTAVFECTFLDADTGEQLVVCAVGQGQDPGDKAAYKAFTGAVKYALMKTFLIPTGDDPEEDGEGDEASAPSVVAPEVRNPQGVQAPKRSNGRGKTNEAATDSQRKGVPEHGRATEAQLKKIYAMVREAGVSKEAVQELLQERYGVSKSTELTKRQASDLIDYLSAYADEGEDVGAEEGGSDA